MVLFGDNSKPQRTLKFWLPFWLWVHRALSRRVLNELKQTTDDCATFVDGWLSQFIEVRMVLFVAKLFVAGWFYLITGWFYLITGWFCSQTDEGEDDLKKGTQLLEIYALEIQMYTAQKNNKKLKVLEADSKFLWLLLGRAAEGGAANRSHVRDVIFASS